MLDNFSNEQKFKILSATGYTGSSQSDEMDAYEQSKPEAQSLVKKLAAKATAMKSLNKGGLPIAGFNLGGMTLGAGVSAPNTTYVNPNKKDQILKDETGTASTTTGATVNKVNTVKTSTIGKTDTASVGKKTGASTYDADTTAGGVGKITRGLGAEEGEVSDDALVDAAQLDESSVSGLEAAQGTAYLMDNPVQRKIEDGELISGVANASTASKFTEQIQAAQARPSQRATVQGQLNSLMKDFEGGETPSWAAGALRAATAAMASRGLGASSMAGQAVVQAAMEAALPIASADAQTNAQFESQNLSNRQQRAMLAAQQRAAFMGQEFDQKFQARVANASKISDVANMNFTAEQQVALENSRATNSMNMANLSNSQAMVMAEAAALANMDMANLNNRQQAAIQNANSFLQMDMANLDNRQQTSMFKAQQNIQAIFTDRAAQNAAKQFNAASENQTNQFFADLQVNVSKFNADQKNATRQINAAATNQNRQFNAATTNENRRFNATVVNATRQFNTNQKNQFKQFNITNSLVVAQANAKWRQTAALENQAAANENALYVAKEQNLLSNAELDEIWQRERDEMDYLFNSFENDQDRANKLIMTKLQGDATLSAATLQAKIEGNKNLEKAFYEWITG